jgi:hypothetical protein
MISSIHGSILDILSGAPTKEGITQHKIQELKDMRDRHRYADGCYHQFVSTNKLLKKTIKLHENTLSDQQPADVLLKDSYLCSSRHSAMDQVD